MASPILSYKQLELVNALEKARDKTTWAVIDARVKNLLPQWLQFSPGIFWLQRPEEQKNLDVFGEATDFFLKQGLQRKDRLFAIGGGATTDFAGFIAATLHRGIHWTAIPTTLIGMVDAAIGGKTAINTRQGKNLLGCFHQPDEVWICPDFLRTLTSGDLLSGKGEILKYALLDSGIHEAVMSKNYSLEELILRCANFKQDVVNRDPLDLGERMFLNLGHTVGHALEFSLHVPHGLAVAMGMKYLFKALEMNSVYMSFDKIRQKLDVDETKIDLGSYPRFDKEAFWHTLAHDKKRVLNDLNLVVVEEVGKPRLRPIPLVQLRQRLETLDEFRA